MDSLAEIKQNDNLIINSDEIEKEIDAYFDNISKEELIKDLTEVDIEVEEIQKNKSTLLLIYGGLFFGFPVFRFF